VRPGVAGAGVTAWAGAILSSLCCLLPLAVIVLGLGSGAFMSVTMRYRWLLIPLGIIGVTTGFFLYVRERRRCTALACRMVGSRVTFALLVVATLVVTTSIVLDRFPELTSDVLARAIDGDGPRAGHDMGGMRWFFIQDLSRHFFLPGLRGLFPPESLFTRAELTAALAGARFLVEEARGRAVVFVRARRP